MDLDVKTDPANLEGVPDERPVLAVVIAVIVATVVYLGIQLAMDGTIDLVETAAFAIVFTGVYAAFLYLRTRLVEESE